MTGRILTRLIACCAACCAPAVALAESQPGEVEWRSEYDKARKEAESTGRPLVIDVTSQNCFYCKQLDTTTFRDPAIITLLNGRCIPLKVDASANPRLATALGVQNYPTLVFASPDGRILDLQTGFIEAPPLQDKIQRALATVTAGAAPDWMSRDLQEATHAAEASDFARAMVLLNKIVEDGKDRPVQTQARRMIQRLEEQAANRHAKARELAESGQVALAVEQVAETVRLYPGTRAAREGSQLLVTLVSRREPSGPVAVAPASRTQVAHDLLVQARADFGRRQFLNCLDRCEAIVSTYPDAPEADEAAKIVADIKGNPELTKQAAEQMGDRLSLLYLSMAENWLRKGQPQQAVFYLERVVQTFPNSRHAELAQVRLAQIQGAPVRITDRK
jgi:hypothetical protein